MSHSTSQPTKMLSAFFLLLTSLAVLPAEPHVSISTGLLRGATTTSRDGREYLAFTKIPFALPPLGRLRFMDPRPADSWSGILDASKPNTVCLQNIPNPTEDNQFLGEEDCLYLNVYTPKINASLPVIFYVHGGGWSFGNSGPQTMARYFMDEDVILVMINYRLGPLGFLSTEDTTLPGNMGLKDMALALEWTKKEIKFFGGNPELITAFGFSAGAASVHYLCSIPKTKDLLKGCISQSGAGGSHFSLRKLGLSRNATKVVTNLVGCETEDLIHCLQSKSAEEITAAEKHLRFWLGEPLVVMGPVLEPEERGSLLTRWPVPDSKFPWLLGVCGDEGADKSAFLELNGNSSTFNDFTENQEDYLQRMLSLERNDFSEVRRIVGRFFENGVIPGMQKLYSEGYSVWPSLKAAKEHNGVKYFYVFNYTSGPSMSEFRANRTLNITGIGHGEDNKYFFDISHIYKPKDWPQQKDVDLSKKLIKLWVHFAKYQTPNLEGVDPYWRPFENEGYYLEIGNIGFTVKKYKNMEEIINFWKNIK